MKILLTFLSGYTFLFVFVYAVEQWALSAASETTQQCVKENSALWLGNCE